MISKEKVEYSYTIAEALTDFPTTDDFFRDNSPTEMLDRAYNSETNPLRGTLDSQGEIDPLKMQDITRNAALFVIVDQGVEAFIQLYRLRNDETLVDPRLESWRNFGNSEVFVRAVLNLQLSEEVTQQYQEVANAITISKGEAVRGAFADANKRRDLYRDIRVKLLQQAEPRSAVER